MLRRQIKWQFTLGSSRRCYFASFDSVGIAREFHKSHHLKVGPSEKVATERRRIHLMLCLKDRYADAISACDIVLSEYPHDIVVSMYKCEALFASERFDAAIAGCDLILAKCADIGGGPVLSSDI
uniref:Uncharacterized protein n=1 Tax=Spongospora subterranea TaxID=70186 RepID=A0A0H5REP1_9EUKA|eukprot:CRZ12002.1 hypothetical protein [Spongospora subterranea]